MNTLNRTMALCIVLQGWIIYLWSTCGQKGRRVANNFTIFHNLNIRSVCLPDVINYVQRMKVLRASPRPVHQGYYLYECESRIFFYCRLERYNAGGAFGEMQKKARCCGENFASYLPVAFPSIIYREARDVILIFKLNFQTKPLNKGRFLQCFCNVRFRGIDSVSNGKLLPVSCSFQLSLMSLRKMNRYKFYNVYQIFRAVGIDC